MAIQSNASTDNPDWAPEAYAMAAQAKVLSGNKLEELVVRLQRRTGKTKDQCWRFIIQNALKRNTDHRRWKDEEIDEVREELVRKPIEEVAEKLRRTPQAIRSMLRRHHLSMREIRCDRFSLESLSAALRIRKSEIHYWISQGWLLASVEVHGRKRMYVITPEALNQLYKQHLPKLLARGAPNLSLFEAYLQYCYSPKHTIGTQLLDVRRDKKERAAFEANKDKQDPEEGEDEDETDNRYYFKAQDDLALPDDGGDYRD
jgi:hypothetical protein